MYVQSKHHSDLPAPGEETFFLWGARQIGKSTLLRERFDEVHWLIENRGLHFALCGSSARCGAANLLGGRALRYELHGLTADELGDEFDLSRMLNHGYLPRMYEADRPARRLDAYVADYHCCPNKAIERRCNLLFW